jgi:hypothetical protein
MTQNDSQQAPPDASSDPPPEQWPKGTLARLRRRAFRKWPRWFPDPDFESRLKIWREHDAEDNEKTQPPPDEHAQLLCLWALEYYTPAHAQSLVRNLAALGWDRDYFGSRNTIPWVQSLRRSVHGFGYMSLGAIVRPDDRRIFAARRDGPLPPHVDYAIGDIISPASSITCVSIGFVLSDYYTQRVNEALRRRYDTWLEPLGRGYRHHSPEIQKRAATDGIRAELRAMAAGWFRAHLPGVFAGGLLGGEFPTCELLTLRAGRPFSRQPGPDGRPPGYFDALDIWPDFNTWRLEQTPDLKFTAPLYRDSHSFHAILAAKETDLPEEELKIYGGQDRRSVIGYADDRVDDLLPVWGLDALLTGYERHLTAVRDTAAPGAKSGNSPRRELERLRRHIAQSADMAGVAAAVIDAAQGAGFTHGIATFRPANPELWKDEKDITLAKALSLQIQSRAEWLQTADRAARDLHTQYASVLAALENIKLQTSVRWLNRWLVVLTVAIAILTAIMAFPPGR